ncbi:membrane protein [Nocardia sp. CNY236]|uniref:membrane protein n=1 Tax=Nocardia sp. CNY236 TaxID=1169152 RepID=UPI00040EBA45|nr:membrane protein [Nocardia sp. CNY236]
MLQGGFEKAVVELLDTGSRVQAPAVAGYVDRLRQAHPDDSPAQIIARLERHYLLAVTGSGAAAGATATFPGIGTVSAIAAVTAETAFFLEASAVFTLSVAAVHGISPEDRQQRRALVLTVVLGERGIEILQKRIGSTAKNWGATFAHRIPGLAGVNDSLLERFIVRWFTKRTALIVGKVLPAGVGAVIGGAGNRALGSATIANARNAFGSAPALWPTDRLVVDADTGPAARSEHRRPSSDR